MSSKKHQGLTRRTSGLMALEPRFMFDGAAVVDAIQTTADAAPVLNDAKALAPQALQQAEQLAQQKVAEFLGKATDQEIFNLFNGGKQAPDADWAERLNHLRDSLNGGETGIQVLMMDRASQFNAIAAFAANGPDGKPTIFVNPYWAGLLGNEDLSSVLIEEIGHWMDSVLNPDADTAGDEGQHLADVVLGKEAQASRDGVVTDSGWVTVAGVSYEVEFASFNFVNAYEMVYDLDNDTFGKTTAQISTADIDVNERWADKEQNLHYFNSSRSLGVVSISDGTSGQNFSGNDVSAISVIVNGETLYGWISRPIKANGVVRGFYFWTDTYTFTPLTDYAGPVPVISYTIRDDFNATSTATLSITVTQVNDAPAGTDKTIQTFENKSYTLTASDFGFTDPNDSPPNSFLSVIITTLPTAGTLTLNGTAVTAGQEILVSALSGLVFTPVANANGSTYATLTFQVRDNGGTANAGVNLDPTPNSLTFNVQAVNSAPVAVADTATVGEAGGVNNGTNSTPSVSGNVLTNDTDADAGDTKTVSAVSGLAAGTVGSSVSGRYGSLVLNANGSYTYTTDNDNPTVQALRLNTDSLTDSFAYTVTDGSGLSSTTTLTITITGANDFPVAINDYNSVKEAATATSGSFGTATGNVLNNDTDVDGGTLVVESASSLPADSDTLTVTSPITSATYTVVDKSTSGNWTSGVGNNSASPQNVLVYNGTSWVTVSRQDGGGKRLH